MIFRSSFLCSSCSNEVGLIFLEFENVWISQLFVVQNILNEIPLFYLSSNDNQTVQKIATFDQITFSENSQNSSSQLAPLFLSSQFPNWVLSFDLLFVYNNSGSR